MSRRPRIFPPPVTSAHGFAGDVPDYARTRADARRQRARSASLGDGEEGGGSVFPDFDNVNGAWLLQVSLEESGAQEPD